MASKKKTNNRINTKKRTNNKAVKPAKVAAKKNEQASPAIFIALAVAAVFLGLSCLNIFGKVGGALKYVQHGLFGWVGYLFSVVLLAVFVYLAISKHRDKVIVIFSFVLYAGLGVLVHLVSGLSLKKPVVDFFIDGARDQCGGGIIFGTIAAGLYLAISKAGAIIVSIILMLLSLFMIFRKKIFEIFADVSDDDAERRQPKTKVRNTASPYEEAQMPKKVKTKEKTICETSDGTTVVRIVKSTTKSRRRRFKRPELERASKKAAPMRDGSVSSIDAKIAKGVAVNTSVAPSSRDNGDIHEITSRKQPEGKNFDFKIEQTDAASADIRAREMEAAALVARKAEEERKAQEERAARRKAELQARFENKESKQPQSEAQIKEAEEITRPSQAPVYKVDGIPAEKYQERKSESEGTQAPKQRAELSGTTFSTGPAQRTFEPVHQVKGAAGDNFQLPPITLLNKGSSGLKGSEDVMETADDLVDVLKTFGVNVELMDIQVGPSVTRFELKPELGTRVSKVTSLVDDLKLNLAVSEMRIEAPIPGKAAIGIEIPNKSRQTVTLRELIESEPVKNHKSKIAFSAGKDISGNVIVSDLAKMPHMLVAGTTGSGKSVFLNSILMCMLYRAKPTELGLIIVDPKKVEFGVYAGIPHLMKPVVTDPGQAVSTLRWAVGEMTNRYQRMQMSGVRDFKTYNEKFENGQISPEENDPKRMQQIVIVIDELADLMMVAAKEVESLICRLAQLARAAGIHLIIATQRPSVDVVTGLIKANIPARVALLVSSGIDSRTIIDMVGAEKLLGNGDMLFYPTGYVKPLRVQGAFVTDEEIQKTVKFLTNQKLINYYEKEQAEMEKFNNASGDSSGSEGGQGQAEADSSSRYDEYLFEAGKLCIDSGKASSSMLQRRFSVGFNRAARIIDQLCEIGAIGPQNGSKPREILVDSFAFEEMCQDLGIIDIDSAQE